MNKKKIFFPIEIRCNAACTIFTGLAASASTVMNYYSVACNEFKLLLILSAVGNIISG